MLSRRIDQHRGNTKYPVPDSTSVVTPCADGSWREVDESWYAVDEWLDESFGTPREPDDRTPPPRWESLPKVQPLQIRPQQRARVYREPHPGRYITFSDDMDRSSVPSFDFDRGALFDGSDVGSTTFRPSSANPNARVVGLPSLSIPTSNNALARSVSPHDSPQEFETSGKSPGRATYSVFPKIRARATALWSGKDSTLDAENANRQPPSTPKFPPTSFGSPVGGASPGAFVGNSHNSQFFLGDLAPRAATPMPLTEDQLQGLCKGAVKTVLSKSPSGFNPAKRAVGVYGLEPCWKCSKCDFKGAMAYHRQSGKPQNSCDRAFDPTIRTSLVRGIDGFTGGVRYRWIFLAKCHTTLKAKAADASSFDQPHADEMGGFGCVFCCADESQPSVFFQNVTSFLQHLELHRREDMWPNPDISARMKCVAGRSAGKHEDWEINLMPLISQS